MNNNPFLFTLYLPFKLPLSLSSVSFLRLSLSLTKSTQLSLSSLHQWLLFLSNSSLHSLLSYSSLPFSHKPISLSPSDSQNSVSITFHPSPVTETTADVHDLLPHYGLPKGLIPNNVDSFTLSDDGTFTLQLSSPCYVQFDQLVYYDKKISGKLSYGSVSGVSGIQAKKLFLWVSVTGIQADKDSDMIEFYVGSLSEKLPAKQFEDVRVCKTKACTGTTSATKSESI